MNDPALTVCRAQNTYPTVTAILKTLSGAAPYWFESGHIPESIVKSFDSPIVYDMSGDVTVERSVAVLHDACEIGSDVMKRMMTRSLPILWLQ